MAERLRDACWVTLRLNFRLKGYVSRQYLCTVMGEWSRPTTSLPLEVLTQRNFVSHFIGLKLNFIKKTENNRLSHRLGELGVTYAFHL